MTILVLFGRRRHERDGARRRRSSGQLGTILDVGAITRFTPTSIPDEFDAEIFAMNADGSSEVQVTNSTGVLGNGQGSWSPLGTKIVVSSDRDANTEIYAVNVVGSGETRLTNDAASDGMPAWACAP